MDEVVDTIIITIERLLNKKDIELDTDGIDRLRDLLDEILEEYER